MLIVNQVTSLVGSGRRGNRSSEQRSPGSGQRNRSLLVRSSVTRQSNGVEDVSQAAWQASVSWADALPAAPASAASISSSNEQASNLTAHDAEDLERTSFLSNAVAFTQAAIELAAEFSDPCPLLNATVRVLLVAMKGFEKVDEIQDNFAYAAEKLTRMKTVHEISRPRLDISEKMIPSLKVIAQSIQMVERTLKSRADRGVLQRIWEYPNDVKAVSKVLRMLGDFADLFVMNLTASTHSMVQDQTLNELNFVPTAQFLAVKDRKQCTEGTRTELLTDLLTWATTASNVPTVCLLTGPAGSGKSTIAQTICSFLRALDRLGGSFFCSRGDGEKRQSTQSIFSTLARFLASQDREYALALIQVLQRNVGVGSVVALEQLTNLVLAPIREARSGGSTCVAPVRVLVIDALDECADDGDTIYELMRTLLAECSKLPLKILITSRPENHITRAFEQAQSGCYVGYRIEDVPEDIARGDVLTYLRSELRECAQACNLPTDWPPDVQVETLAKQAGTLFIYASTACKYIRRYNDDAAQLLEELTTLPIHRLEGIDSMYEFVLNQAQGSKRPSVWKISLLCLQAIVCLRQPLSLHDLAYLMDVDPRKARTALEGLQSVLNIPSSDHPNIISVYHASFPDYLIDKEGSRCGPWFMESTIVHTNMLRRCLSIMNAELHFNISDSHTSYVTNGEQPTRRRISGALQYSCLHWMGHLERCGDLSVNDMAELSKLLHGRFLYWLEVLSVISCIKAASFIMTRLSAWTARLILPTHDSDVLCPKDHRDLQSERNLRQFAGDARAFVNMFATPIETSCPHIYLSALAATSNQSKVWSGLSTAFQNLPCTIAHQPQDICLPLVLYDHGMDNKPRPAYDSRDHAIVPGCVAKEATSGSLGRNNKPSSISLSFSPDGKYIVSGSERSICLWDAITGAAIGEPLHGHEKGITSVAFSPDSTRIVSGSHDCTIRLWDLATRAPIGEPLRGHEHGVSSVAFSPDGTCIVSGSHDGTIRRWDAVKRLIIGEPLRGHEDRMISVESQPDITQSASRSCHKKRDCRRVFTKKIWGNHRYCPVAVAFSPDGALVVSGSLDRTIRLWDAITGAADGDPLAGHEKGIVSVAFSPDSTRIVSGSHDCTIRLWDVAKRAPIGEPLYGHSCGISSVMFSPDGGRIVSSSHDCTIRLWDVASGVAIGQSLSSHSDKILSVAIAPDGTRIVSGSKDQTICLWDLSIQASMRDAPRGHEHQISSVAFSPNGARLVSGSWDRTICLWDASTGTPVRDSLCGHEQWITSVAFSSDGTLIVSASKDQTIRLWNACTGEDIGGPLRGHEQNVSSVMFSPDGARIVSGSEDQTVRLWDVATKAAHGNPLRGHDSGISSVAYSSNGARIVSGSLDQTIRLWDATTGEAIGNPLRGHEQGVTSVTFSPDGTLIVSCSDDKTIRLWDAATGAAVRQPMSGHENSIASVTFSPDGTRIVSGSEDRTVRLWDVKTGAAIGDPLRGHASGITCVAYSSDGRRLASSSKDQTIRIWDAVDTGSVVEESSSTDGNGEFFGEFLPNVNHSTFVATEHLDASPQVGKPATDTRIAFSREDEHCICINDFSLPGRDPRDTFTLDKDGWLRGPRNELLLWLPAAYRRALWWPRTRAVMGTPPVMLDLSRFVHGENWTRCFSVDTDAA